MSAFLFVKGLVTETFVQSDNRTVELSYCWSPNDSRLLTNPTYMITRQILRLIVYYLFPLVTVSVFYTLIAKHLFQAKSVLFTPVTSQPFLNQLSGSRRSSPNTLQTRSLSNQHSFSALVGGPVRHQSQPTAQLIVSNAHDKRESAPARSSTFDNERLMKTQESLGSISSFLPSSLSLTQNLRRSRDLLYETSGITTKNYLAMHTLYQDAKTRKQLRARRKVAKTVLFLCSVFFICWLPKQIHDLYW